jgi:hypothetical protein
MSPQVLDRDEVTVDDMQLLPEGTTTRVVPSDEFGNVVFDPKFTGTASQGAFAPYFSQLQNLWDMVIIREPYAPDPVAERFVFVSIHHAPFFASGSAVRATDIAAQLGYIKTRGSARVASATEALPVAEPASQTSLAEVAEKMRDLVDLPVQDIARMAGIGRRQYYNILRGKAETRRSSADEQRFHLLYELLSQLHERLGDARAVRGALLMPLEELDFRSFIDVAAESASGLPSAYDALVAALNAGRVPRGRRLPPSGKMSPDDPRWAEAADFLRDYRPTHE